MLLPELKNSSIDSVRMASLDLLGSAPPAAAAGDW